MSVSAFGIDHGREEIIKFPMPKVPGMGAGAHRAAGGFNPLRSVQNAGTKVAGMAKPMGAAAGRNLGAGKTMRAGAQMNLGRGLKRAGTFAQQRPGAAAGILGTGVGGSAAFGVSQNRKKPGQF